MGVMYPIYQVFNERIFDGMNMTFKDRHANTEKRLRCNKTFEFRKAIPKKLKVGDTIYVYEPKKMNGAGAVIGEFKVKAIRDCNSNATQVGYYGAAYFMPYFCRYILNEPDKADLFEEALKIGIPGYKGGYVLKFALDPDSMAYIKANQAPPEPQTYVFNNKRIQLQELAETYWRWCDDWLAECGFYGENGMSNYNYAFEIEAPVKYDTPRPLTDFIKLDGSPVEKAPQNYYYIKD